LVDYLRLIRGSLDRATGLTQRMLAFARRQTLQPRPTDVDALVTSLEELIRRTVGPGIAVHLELEQDPWPTLCDPNQLESALLNLAINARDAMQDGGTLRIATAKRRITKADLTDSDGAEPGDYVEITVADDGPGMSAEVKARAFEPFFTTKPTGQGTGLGLSQLYGFVRQSGGLLRLESEPGQGTTLRLLLPRSRDDAAPDAPQADEPQRPASDPELVSAPGLLSATVLVVDDEPAVRALVADMLGDMGFEVVEAADAADAMQTIETGPAIDLLVTDVGLPGLNGPQLADLVRQGHPELPVLLITGYAGDAVDQAALPSGIELLHKPFTLETLASRVQAALRFARVT
jgi:CheY-like chemotaxis protein